MEKFKVTQMSIKYDLYVSERENIDLNKKETFCKKYKI